MKILAVESSSHQRSVAVLADGVSPVSSPSPLNGERVGVRGVKVLGEATEAATRSTPALAMVEKALREAGLEREEIECLALGLGPGSYTGIRAAIALAQGWQLARPVKLLGISSAECLAAEAQANNLFGIVNIVIDAQRNELYLARYEITREHYREISPLTLVTAEATKPASPASPEEFFIGPEAPRWFPNGKILFPTAATLARLAATRTNFIPGEKIEPIYLRETNFVKAPPPRVLPGE
jgi:tRNA threonylcarbamoyl adenosine modification protein YeaZ